MEPRALHRFPGALESEGPEEEGRDPRVVP